MARRILTTAVIGAGPAGLLFSIVGRLLHERQGRDPEAWEIRLYDKRDSYARTHRLRMDPAPYLEIQRDLHDPRFDEIVAFLREHDFAPEVNALEARLAGLLSDLGVRKERLAIGGGPGEVTLPGLRRALEEGGRLAPDERFTVVAADSVHSAVRDSVCGGVRPIVRTHERVARLRVVGEDLPRRLGLLDRVRLSRVLGSIVDYRRNRNGFAEIDLFLTEAEHDAVRELGATPREPVPISSRMLSAVRAPLFRSLVAHLERDLASPGHDETASDPGRAAPREVLLHSTFHLEHMLMPQLVFEVPAARAHVFLLGDAAISLPFFRGMACLARCAHSLAHAHCDLVARAERSDAPRASPAIDAEIRRYLLGEDRPLRLGSRLLPGRIVDVRPTVHHGEPAFAVLHRWLFLYGVHVLRREDDGGFRALRSYAPAPRAAALAELGGHLCIEQRYDREVAAIKKREVAIVEARSRLVRGAREIARVSALLPFPIQSWLLRAPDLDRAADRWSLGLWINAALALAAATVALSGLLLAASGYPRAGRAAWASLPVQLLGGVAYHAAVSLERGPHRWVRGVWQIQLAGVFAGGALIAAWASWSAGRLAEPIAAAWSILLAAAFIVGLYAFEAIVKDIVRRAELSEP